MTDFIMNRKLGKFGEELAVNQEGITYAKFCDEICDTLEDAEIIHSHIDEFGDFHMPVIDLDFSCHLEPSTQENHYHLYINREVPWEKYLKLLDALVDCGLVEGGYRDASERRGYSSVRKPGVKKKIIPEDEQWLYDNKDALESVQRGIEQAKKDEFVHNDDIPF